MSFPGVLPGEPRTVPVISRGRFARAAAARSTAVAGRPVQRNGCRFRGLALALDVQHAVAAPRLWRPGRYADSSEKVCARWEIVVAAIAEHRGGREADHEQTPQRL